VLRFGWYSQMGQWTAPLHGGYLSNSCVMCEANRVATMGAPPQIK